VKVLGLLRGIFENVSDIFTNQPKKPRGPERTSLFADVVPIA